MTIPILSSDPKATPALTGEETNNFFFEIGKGTDWKNEITIRRCKFLLLMLVVANMIPVWKSFDLSIHGPISILCPQLPF
jgi:hypothetical protein